MIPQVTTKPNICRRLSGNLKRCGCRCTQGPLHCQPLRSSGEIPFSSSLGFSWGFCFSATAAFEMKQLNSLATNQCIYLMGLEVTKEELGGLLWRWSIPGGGHVCSGSFVAERNRRQRKGELRSPDGCCPLFSLALISETEGVRDLWKMQLGSGLTKMEDPDAFQEWVWDVEIPVICMSEATRTTKERDKTLAGVAYYTKNRPVNHTLPVKQKAKPKLRPSIHAPITQMPFYFLRKVGFKTEAMKSRCGFSYG